MNWKTFWMVLGFALAGFCGAFLLSFVLYAVSKILGPNLTFPAFFVVVALVVAGIAGRADR